MPCGCEDTDLAKTMSPRPGWASFDALLVGPGFRCDTEQIAVAFQFSVFT